VIGIEIVAVDARVVIASVDTYLRFAEAANRLDLGSSEAPGVPELIETGPERLARAATKGVITGAREFLFGED
jgi:gas vesicle structural protein